MQKFFQLHKIGFRVVSGDEFKLFLLFRCISMFFSRHDTALFLLKCIPRGLCSVEMSQVEISPLKQTDSQHEVEVSVSLVR